MGLDNKNVIVVPEAVSGFRGSSLQSGNLEISRKKNWLRVSGAGGGANPKC